MVKIRDAARPINRLRSEILDHIRARAADAPGLFSLTVPTGGGKTIGMLRLGSN
jgi:CRISPR-associated endonuclease/helicase Cas3